jgi:hypothetical protein
MTDIFKQLNAINRRAFVGKWREEALAILGVKPAVKELETPAARLDRLAAEYASTPCAPLSAYTGQVRREGLHPSSGSPVPWEAEAPLPDTAPEGYA